MSSAPPPADRAANAGPGVAVRLALFAAAVVAALAAGAGLGAAVPPVRGDDTTVTGPSTSAPSAHDATTHGSGG